MARLETGGGAPKALVCNQLLEKELRLLERLIFAELLKTTLMALIASSGLLMAVGAMLEASTRGLDPIRVIQYMPFLIAPTLPYTLPSCLLFACTLVYGQMSGSNEITAIKASGIHAYRVIWPAVVLGLVAWGIGIQLVDRIIPACNRAFANAIYSDIEGTIYAYIKQQGAIVQPDFPYELYVRSVQDSKLHNVIIKHRKGFADYDMVAKAAEATLRVVENGPGGERFLEIRLIDGVASTGGEHNVHFRDKTELMPVPQFLGNPEHRNEALSFSGLRGRVADRRRRAFTLDVELAHAAALSAIVGEPLWLAVEIDPNRNERRIFEAWARETESEVYLRMAQTTAPLPFILLGVPMSILYQKRDFLRTFFVCFTPIVTLYYPAMILCFNMVKETNPSNVPFLWMPSVVMAAASIPILRRVARY